MLPKAEIQFWEGQLTRYESFVGNRTNPFFPLIMKRLAGEDLIFNHAKIPPNEQRRVREQFLETLDYLLALAHLVLIHDDLADREIERKERAGGKDEPHGSMEKRRARREFFEFFSPLQAELDLRRILAGVLDIRNRVLDACTKCDQELTKRGGEYAGRIEVMKDVMIRWPLLSTSERERIFFPWTASPHSPSGHESLRASISKLGVKLLENIGSDIPRFNMPDLGQKNIKRALKSENAETLIGDVKGEHLMRMILIRMEVDRRLSGTGFCSPETGVKEVFVDLNMLLSLPTKDAILKALKRK